MSLGLFIRDSEHTHVPMDTYAVHKQIVSIPPA